MERRGPGGGGEEHLGWAFAMISSLKDFSLFIFSFLLFRFPPSVSFFPPSVL